MALSIHDLENNGTNLDLTGTPTHECICGGLMFKVLCSFEDYEMSTYSTEGECVDCGTRVTVPTPVDKPGYYRQ